MTTISDKADQDDRKLLELAAKAAGIEGRMVGWIGEEWFERTDVTGYLEGYKPRIEWNPLTDDGDALRLAVKLGLVISVNYELGLAFCTSIDRQTYQASEGLKDPYAATRRAIVRAAAAIGRSS